MRSSSVSCESSNKGSCQLKDGAEDIDMLQENKFKFNIFLRFARNQRAFVVLADALFVVSADRKSVVLGTSVSVRVDIGGCCSIKTKRAVDTTHDACSIYL